MYAAAAKLREPCCWAWPGWAGSRDAARGMSSLPPARDYYQILGVRRSATVDEIKARYRELALELHPDRTTEPHLIERFKQVSEAHQVLTDQGQRRLLDDYLEQRSFRRANFRGEDSFMDRLAGVRRPRRQAGGNRATARAFRFLEIALSPRVLMIGGGLAFMAYIAFGPRDNLEEDHLMVPAWFNHKTQRWESPAPWDPDYRAAAANRQQMRVHKYRVFESAPPGPVPASRGPAASRPAAAAAAPSRRSSAASS